MAYAATSAAASLETARLFGHNARRPGRDGLRLDAGQPQSPAKSGDRLQQSRQQDLLDLGAHHATH